MGKGRVNEVEPKDDDEAARNALETETHLTSLTSTWHCVLFPRR